MKLGFQNSNKTHIHVHVNNSANTCIKLLHDVIKMLHSHIRDRVSEVGISEFQGVSVPQIQDVLT